MMHSVVHTVSAKMLKDVLLEAAELHKLEPHPSLLRLRAVVTDQPCGQVGLLSELTTGSLATLLETCPVQLTWDHGLLALATDVDQLMNSRQEWHQPSLNRVTVTREVRQPRRRNNNNNNTGNSSRQPGTN